MPSNFNDTTPAAPAGAINVKWQTDGSGNNSAYIVAGAAGGVLVKTTTYSVTTSDSGVLFQANSATPFTITLLGTAPANGTYYTFKNVNTGALTIARNGLTIDGASSNLTLYQGDSVLVMSDGSNYKTGLPRTMDVIFFAPGVGTNSQNVVSFKMTRACIFPASAPNSLAVATVAATGSTTYTLKKNGSGFATIVFSASGTTGAFTQASDASFVNGDVFECDGPATADATLANVSVSLQGYRF